MMVPTVDTVRYTALLELCIGAARPALLCGGTGVGKSAMVHAALRALSGGSGAGVNWGAAVPAQAAPVVTAHSIVFSAQTSSQEVQALVEAKLERKRKNRYGPPAGRRAVFFVDDVNMPAREQYGAQPPVELLRQLLDRGGCYDRCAGREAIQAPLARLHVQHCKSLTGNRRVPSRLSNWNSFCHSPLQEGPVLEGCGGDRAGRGVRATRRRAAGGFSQVRWRDESSPQQPGGNICPYMARPRPSALPAPLILCAWLWCRFLRHLTLVAVPPPSEAATKAIVSALVGGWLADFGPDLRSMGTALVDASVDAYNRWAARVNHCMWCC